MIEPDDEDPPRNPNQYFGKFLSSLVDPKFSGKAEDWPNFESDWLEFVDLHETGMGGRKMLDKIKLEYLKNSLDEHTRNLSRRGKKP